MTPRRGEHIEPLIHEKRCRQTSNASGTPRCGFCCAQLKNCTWPEASLPKTFRDIHDMCSSNLGGGYAKNPKAARRNYSPNNGSAWNSLESTQPQTSKKTNKLQSKLLNTPNIRIPGLGIHCAEIAQSLHGTSAAALDLATRSLLLLWWWWRGFMRIGFAVLEWDDLAKWPQRLVLRKWGRGGVGRSLR